MTFEDIIWLISMMMAFSGGWITALLWFDKRAPDDPIWSSDESDKEIE